MTPRERVQIALNHACRTACLRDFWAETGTCAAVGLRGHDDRDRLLGGLQVDVRHLEAAGPAERSLGDGVFQNFWGERYVYRPTPRPTAKTFAVRRPTPGPWTT